ncbi:MAG: metallophosphoesterase [Puniceicoccales bacterium]|nr:metallophosphoesterase [Puniceicoccales bacterium]
MRHITPFVLSCLIFFACFPQASAQKYTPPQLEDPKSWSMVLLPDPQTYVKFERNQPLLDLQTIWIKENIVPLNIGLVLCTGDLVEQNDYPNPNGKSSNQTSAQQWTAVAKAFDYLNGASPTIIASGNHDYNKTTAIEPRQTFLPDYFYPSRNPKTEAILVDMGVNAEGKKTLENAAYEFISPHGRKFLIVSLEFAPREAALNWAIEVVNREKYRNHTVILLTHSYLESDNKHIVKEGYKLTDANYGAAIFKKLVQPSKNIQLVLSGHIGSPNSERSHLGFRTDKNAAGKTVQQMTFNAQALGGGWMGNGGDGWLRILEFLPDGKTIRVKTFSPLFAISPSTQHLAWRTEQKDQFSFILE